jgi:hypothetical protein
MAWKDLGTDGIEWLTEMDPFADGVQFEAWLNDALSVPLSVLGETSAVDAALKYGGIALNPEYKGLPKNALNAPSDIVSAVQQYRSSECVTVAGKLVDAALGGVISEVQNLEMSGGFQVGDAVVGVVIEKVFGVKGVSIADHLSNSVHAAVVLGEGAVLSFVDDDTAGMERFHQKALANEYGLFRITAELGEALGGGR